MMQPRSTFAAKTILLVLLIFLWIAAGTFIFIGSYSLHVGGDISHVAKSSSVFVPAIICLSVGVLLFVLGLVGCFACTMDNKPLLGVFVALMIFVCLAQITAATLGMIYRGQLEVNVEAALKKEMANYSDDSAFSHEIDFIQTYYECCGIRNASDWYETAWYKQHAALPDSCCKGGNCSTASMLTTTTRRMTTTQSMSKGVFAALEKVVDEAKSSFVEGLLTLQKTVMHERAVALSTPVPAAGTTRMSTTSVSPTALPTGSVFPSACLTKLETVLRPNLVWLVAVAGFFTVLEIIGLLAACLLLRRSGDIHYEQFGIATDDLNI